MANLLRVVGIDTTKGQSAPIDTQLQTPVAPNTQALGVVNNAASYTQKSLADEEASLSGRQQSLNAGLAAQASSIAPALAASSEAVRAISSGRSGGLVSDLLGGVNTLLEGQRKQKAEQRKANALVAQQALGDLKLQWQGELYKQGVAPYRSALIGTLNQYDLDPETKSKLLMDGYGLAEEYTKSTVAAQQTLVQKEREQATEITKAGLLFKINADLAGISTDPYNDPTPRLTAIDSQIANFLQQPGLSELDKNTALAAALNATLKSMDTRNLAYGAIQQRLTAIQQYNTEEQDINKQLQAGQRSPAEAQAWKQYRREQLGVHPGYKDTSPFAAEEYAQQYLSVNQSLDEMRDKQFVSIAEHATMSQDETAYLAWQLIKSNGALLPQFKADKAMAARPGFKVATELFQQYQTAEKAGTAAQLNKYKLVEQLASMNRRDELWFINQENTGVPSVDKLIESARTGIPPGTKELTPEQKQRAAAAMAEARNALAAQINVADNDVENATRALRSYGLWGDSAAIDKRMNSYRATYEAKQKEFQQMIRQQTQLNVQQGNSPPFDPGANRVSFATAKYNGSNVRLPLEQGAQASFGGDYAEQRDTHKHAGIDLSVPAGTKIISPVAGKVIKVDYDGQGYGNYLDVLGDDGKLHRYAHLLDRGVAVRVGQRVKAGTMLGNVGSTGRSSGAHLHYEVRDPNKPYGFDGTVDPLAYLQQSTNARTTSTERMPRSSERFSRQLPQGALPLSNQTYAFDGQFFHVTGDYARPVTPGYTSSNPLRSVALDSRTDGRQRPSSSTDNLGYQALAKKPSFARALHNAAQTLGVPPTWLADIMAVETGGTFNASVDNGKGYVGLIQCGDECRADLRLSYAELAKMTPEQQLTRVVVPHIQNQIRYANSSIKGIEWLQAAIWGGHSLVSDLDKRGAAAVNDPANNDGNITFANYMKRVGSHAGRRYDSMEARAERVTAPIHNRVRASCSMCSALTQQGTFVPHEGTR